MKMKKLPTTNKLASPSVSKFVLVTCLLGLIAMTILGARVGARMGPSPATLQPASGATITVNSGSDNVASNDGKCTLREAINSANNDSSPSPDCVAGNGTDTIIFSGVPLIELIVGLPVLTHDVNIQGPTKILQSDTGQIQTIFLTDATVNIYNLTIANVTSPNVAVFKNFGSLTITNSTISGNESGFNAGNAGVIDNLGSLTIMHSTISNNYGNYGAITNSGSLTVTNSTIRGNTGRGYGGGIYNAGTLNVTASTIDANIVTTLDRNTAGLGGGIYSENGTVTITNSTLSNNSISLLYPGLVLPQTSSRGGGIFIDSGTVSMTNSTLSGNSAANDGGDILNGGTLTMTSCTLKDNSAPGGGGIYNSGTVMMRNSIVALDNASSDLHGAFTSLGYNLISRTFDSTGFIDGVNNDQVGLNPRLLPLANNGGTTKTHALLGDSPAIDKGFSFGSTTDQRGRARPVDLEYYDNAAGSDGSDIGAFESSVAPAILTVTKTDDTNDGVCNAADCSLREAIAAVPLGGTIEFSDLFDSPQTITLVSELTIGKSMRIDGKGADLTTVSGNNVTRVFNIPQDLLNITISGLTIANGNGVGNDYGGGGLRNGSTGMVNLIDCAFINNDATGFLGNGGGLSHDTRGGGGTLNITGCTFSGNTAGEGGAIKIQNTTVTITNTTISGNTAFRALGGGIANYDATLTISSSTITANTSIGFYNSSSAGGVSNITAQTYTTVQNSIIAGNTGDNPDIGIYRATFISNGYNFIGISNGTTGFTDGVNGDQVGTIALPKDPLLDSLADNGGPTRTHALLPGSSAINTGNTATSPATDQRGVARVGVADIGAFEFDGSTPTPTPTPTATPTPSPTPTPNTPPNAAGDAYRVNEDTTLNINAPGVLGNDTDGENNSLMAVVQASPANAASFALNADGSFSYTPNADFNGADSFTYTASDGNLSSDAVTVTITVTAVNDAPTATDQSVTTDEDTTKAITLSGSDADGDALTYMAVTNPAHGTLSCTGANCNYTPAANYNGPDSFTFKDDDGSLNSSAATVNVTVTSVNDVPVASGGSFSTNEDAPSAPFALTGSDADNDSLTFQIVTLPTKGTYNASTGVYTPNANANGSDSFTFVAKDAVSQSQPATVSITITAINDAPTANAQSVSTDEDTSKAIMLTGVDVDGDPLTYTVVTGPAHGNFTSGVYTPAANYNGADSFTFRVNDGSLDSGVATGSITINPVNDAPTAAGQSVTTAEDAAKQITLSGSDVEGSALTYAAGQPSHGTVSCTGAICMYTPAANYNGLDSFTFKANDGLLDSAAATVSITVTPVNDAPAANAQSVSANEDTSKAITLTGVDVDGDPLTYTVVTGPAHGNFASGVYTPAANYNGADSFTFRVNDGSLDSGVATISITINPVNDAPTAAGQSVTTDEDVAKSISLSGNDVDGDALTYIVVTGPAHGSISCTGAGCNYTPAGNYNGPDSFTFRVNDGLLNSATATVSITVTAVNDAPAANAQSVSTNEDTPKAITLTGSDVDGDALTYSVVNGPAHGAFTSGVYTPAANYNGADSFTFKVSDGTLSSAAVTVSITVVPVNDPPVAVNDSVTVNEDSSATTVNVRSNDSDVDGDTLTVTLVTQGTNGSVSITGGGTGVSYTPNANFNGSDSFAYTVSDSNGGSTTATVNVTVTAINDAPMLNYIGNRSTDEGMALTFTASGNDDADNPPNSLTFSLISAPSGASITPAGAFSWTPTESQGPGTFPFRVRVTDNGTPNLFDEEEINVTVREVNAAPVLGSIGNLSGYWGNTYAFTATATDSDLPANSLTYALTGTVPAGASISPAGTFNWTPTSLQAGAYTFTVRVTDNGTPSLSDSKTFTITIGKRPTRLVYSGASAGQYSDSVPLSATLTDNGGGALQGTVIASETIGFTLGTQVTGGVTNPSGVAGVGLTLTQMAQASNVLSHFDGDVSYSASSDSDAFTINKEDTAIDYTGDFDLMTAGPSITNATVRLAAKLTQEADGSLGDISKATVTFKIYKFNATDPTYVLPGVTVNTNGEAQLSYTLPADIYTIRVELDGGNGYWVANPVSDGLLNITVPTNEVRSSGGGWVADPTSVNGRARFAFSVTGTKSGQPKGNVSFSYRGTDGFTYLVKSNSWQNGYLQFSAEPGTSPVIYTGSNMKGSCNVQKIDPATGQVVASFGGYTFEIFTKDGDLLNPRQRDSYSITVRSNTSAVFHQVGSQNSLVTLGGGNITNKAK